MKENIPIEELCWAAGIIDGEGCISIHRRHSATDKKLNHSPYYRLDLKVKMVHKPAIERLMNIFGVGNLHRSLPGKRSRRMLWRWDITGNQCINVLQLIRPYLVVKSKEADIAGEFMPLNVKTTFGKRKISEETLNKRQTIYQQMRDVKQYEWTE